MAASWLVIGSNGQLGTDLVELLSKAGIPVVGMDLPAIDITNPSSVHAAFAKAQPTVVVNAAAYTAVDAAETDEVTAFSVNSEGPSVLAKALRDFPDAKLVHVSTDYVFDGSATVPYPEDAPTSPASAYGRTKAAGEEAVLNTLPKRGYVVRTAWLYSAHGPNFVKTMLGLAEKHDTLKVVNDQIGQPTWSRDLAAQIISLVHAQAPAGVYHGTSSGQTTWFSFTQAIFELAGLDPARVEPTTTDNFPRPAPRPSYSVLGHDKWTAVGLAPIRDWHQALQEALPGIQASMSVAESGAE